MLGPYLDGGAALSGGLAGAFLGHRLPSNLRARMPMLFGLASMGLAVTLILKVKFFPAVLLALILGTILGELAHLETAITRGATRIRSVLDRFVKPVEGLTHEEFLSQFVAILVLVMPISALWARFFAR